MVNSHSSINKKNKRLVFLVLMVVFLLFIFETFSGALRFFFALTGNPSLMYLPKILAFILIIYSFFAFRRSVVVNQFYFILFTIFSCLIGVWNGGTIESIAFTFFIWSPFVFAYIFYDILVHKIHYFVIIVWICFCASIVGVYFDLTTQVPWKGFSYQIGDNIIQGNREWTTGGIDRISGFARVSQSLASMLAIFGIFLVYTSKSNILKFFLIVVSSISILLTTSKSTLGAYLIILILSFLRLSTVYKKIIIQIVLLIGIILPLLSVTLNFSLKGDLNSDFEKLLLSSLDDRLVRTWPGIFEIINKYNLEFFGAGIGTVGSALKAFPITSIKGKVLQDLSVIDSTSMYMFATFGITGLYLYLSIPRKFFSLWSSEKTHSDLFEKLLLMIFMIGWMIDVFGEPVLSFTAGMALGLANQKNPSLVRYQ